MIETPGKARKFKARVVAIIRFDECFRYPSKASFEKDYARHKVDSKSPWRWNGRNKWAWEIYSIKILENPLTVTKRLGIRYTKEILL